MEDSADSKTENPNIEPPVKPRAAFRRRNTPAMVRAWVVYALTLSVALFAIFIAGSMHDPGVSDSVLFLLLRLVRYSSIVLCALAVVAVWFGVRNIVSHPCVQNAIAIATNFFLILFGAGMAMVSHLIVEVVKGQG